MAIVRTKSSTEDVLNFDINNGDLVALNEIVGAWGFKDIECALRFGIAVLKITEPGALLRQKDGTTIPLMPTNEITTNKEQSNASNAV
jgi:hypothetical protein